MLATIAVGAAGAPAKECGDDVGGADVPCGCGDTVVSDVVLAGGDPVTTTVCARHGLVVRAPQSERGLTIDLNGKTLRGSGAGIGVWLIHGGGRGARLVSGGGQATIAGFNDGIVGRGSSSAMAVEGIVVRASRRDGVRLSENAYTVRRVDVVDSGRDGFSLGGGRFLVEQTRAAGSGRFGYFVMGREGRIGTAGAGNTAERSGDAGFNVLGTTHQVMDCVATSNGKEGLKLRGPSHRVAGCVANGNGGSGITGMGSGWRLAGNQARRNLAHGVYVRGPAPIDEGGNEGSDNRSSDPSDRVVQCEIGGTTCVD